MELQNLFEVFIFINLIPQATGRSAVFGMLCYCSLKVDCHLRLDSIAVSVFVNIGWVGQIQYQNKRSQYNHSDVSVYWNGDPVYLRPSLVNFACLFPNQFISMKASFPRVTQLVQSKNQPILELQRSNSIQWDWIFFPSPPCQENHWIASSQIQFSGQGLLHLFHTISNVSPHSPPLLTRCAARGWWLL